VFRQYGDDLFGEAGLPADVRKRSSHQGWNGNVGLKAPQYRPGSKRLVIIMVLARMNRWRNLRGGWGMESSIRYQTPD
jgi:hypothetical protein